MGTVLRVGCSVVLASAAVIMLGHVSAAEPVPLGDLVFVTDFGGGSSGSGCSAASIVDARTGSRLAYTPQRYTPLRLGAVSDGSLVLAAPNWGNDTVAGLRQMRRDVQEWSAFVLVPYEAYPGDGVWISPDDAVLLLSYRGRVLHKYLVSEIRESVLGPERGRYSLGAGAGDVQFSADSSTAYVVDTEGAIRVLGVGSLTEANEPIRYARPNWTNEYALRNTHAAMTPDGRYLVINTGRGAINVVDLTTRTTKLVSTPGIVKTLGVEFNYRIDRPTYLAISGHSVVGVYEFSDEGQLKLVSIAQIPRQEPPPIPPGAYGGAGRQAAMAWTGYGDGIVVAINGDKEFRILDFRPGDDAVLQKRLDFDSCSGGLERSQSSGADVLTLNDRLRSPTPSPTATGALMDTPTATRIPPTRTPPLRPSATPTITVSPTPLPSATLSASATPGPWVAFLPVGLREACDPLHKRADVALVIDTSSSMVGQKIEDAKSAALLFVGRMDLAPERDQVAVVRYDREAEVVCELSRAQAVIEAAIRGLAVRNWTHIDKGLRTALAELQSPRHLERNTSVMILLTDGVQTGTPGEELRAAAEVRSAGVRLYTIGLGADVDAAALREMAGDNARYHFAPDSADLARIYAEIAGDILCPAPAGGFWPGP